MKIYSLAFFLLVQFLFVSIEVTSQSFASSSTADSVYVMPGMQIQGDSVQISNENRPRLVSMVYKSADGGQTWQDISKGLPEARQEDAIRRGDFFADVSGLYLVEGNWIYHNKAGSNDFSWHKEIFPGEHKGIASAGMTAMTTYNYYASQFLLNVNGAGVWTTANTESRPKEVHTVFETARGTVFVGTNSGVFKSTNGGKSWKQIQAVGRIVESDGVLVATTQKGILRSTDEGENWELVISEGGVGIAVERIKGGFAAISYNTTSKTRRVRTTYDAGKTWNAIDNELPASPLIASIVQAGENFYCGHPEGVFRSSDKGKTWKLLFPSKDGQVYNLCVSGNVIYAIPRPGGC